jgi:large subunit ribosomal protein L15
MELHDLSPAEGSKPEGQRKGRGVGSSDGERGGRGTKGQKKRNSIPIYFEGGQTPIYRRIPKLGFNSRKPVIYEEVNVQSLNGYEDGEELTPEKLKNDGLIEETEPVKLLGKGELEVESLTVTVHAVSDGARSKVENSNGTVNVVDSPKASQGS